MTARRHLLALAAAAMLALAACGDDGDDEAATTPETTAEAETATQPDEPREEADLDTREKPDVEVPEGDPPAGLQIEDIIEGDGATARLGNSVTVHYVGVSHSTGEQFDASWDRQEPFTFQLGAGQVIPGWDQGVAGMKVGGRRRLIIPPDLAYGESGQPPDIGPNETLVFVVDLLSAR